MADERQEKTRAIDLALSQIEKQFGKGSIMRWEARKPLSYRGDFYRLHLF